MLMDNVHKQPGMRDMFTAGGNESVFASGTVRTIVVAAICLFIVALSVSGLPRTALGLLSAAHANSPAARAEAAGKDAGGSDAPAIPADVVVEMSN